MPTSAREQIVQAAADLIEAQGYHATGLNEIIRASGAPRGSLYYYFPDGKEGLAVAAVERNGRLTAERIRAGLAARRDPAAAVRVFVRAIARHIEASGFRAGGPLTAVAMETVTSSARLNQACRAAYLQIQQAFALKLVESGWSRRRADRQAAFITAAVEGGILLSRTQHSGDPLRQVADDLAAVLRANRPAPPRKRNRKE